ncbi:ABC transporter substrate-binding protein [Clostridium cellulovorans]|uniref:Extracellular solute-binding protein family 1 n=1 Tax=Clostridium cellulovorans (strain ATCC 35296 / DSM 3052 / OCM 3 / 743B) TaxID=573061 RepID=D9SMP2_CLOC7|nr:ABC transporter substrate-binding protein [Clostridium cellulovorans]ADL49827.1 extracellular solute-binding protein family 1 [Clostridium cellulovorans 743B]
MKKTKLLSLLLVSALAVTSLVGCGSKKEEAKTEKDDKAPITFSFYSADGVANDFTDPIAKKITEKTGVSLKIDYPVGGNNQKVPLMIASGEYPDLIYAKGDTTKLVEAGALVPLDDLIDKYGPNIKKLYGDYLNRLRFSSEDKKIYTLGVYGVNNANWKPDGSMQIQNAVLEDAGYPQVKTLDDVYKLIKNYKAKYPTINGQETIGMSLCADDWRWLITVGNPSGFVLGQGDNGQWKVDPETYKAEYKFLDPQMKEYYTWLNKLYKEGLLDPESFTQKYDQYIAKLSTGRVLLISDAYWDYKDANISLNANNQANRTFFPLAVTLNDKVKFNMTNAGYSGASGVGITTSCADPERAIKFIDWLCTDEAQILNNWGIEGVNYEIVDGKRVVPQAEKDKKNTDKDYGKKTGLGQYGYPFPQYGDGVQDESGQYYTTNSKEDIIADYNEAYKKTLAAYGKKMVLDMFPDEKDFPVSDFGAAYNIKIPNDSPITIAQKKADDLSQSKIPQLIMSNNFDADWTAYQKDLNTPELQTANEEMTKLIKATVDLWSGK